MGPLSGLQGNVHLLFKENFEPKPAEADMTAAMAGTQDAFSVGRGGLQKAERS